QLAEFNDTEEESLPDLVAAADCKVQLGDLWVLGNHRLLCGDSLKEQSYSDLLQGKQVDLLHTDPPYNVSYVGKNKQAMTIDNDSMSPEEFKTFLTQAMERAAHSMNLGAPFYVWYADIEAIAFRTACEANELSIRQGLIWKKNQFVLGRQDYQWIHEPCLYGWKEGGPHYWAGGRKQVTILEYDKPLRNDIHPTMKPVGLIEPLILNSCPNNGVVLDPFGGSGSTLIACEKTNRIARLIELSPVYCQRIIERWESLTGLTARKEEELDCEKV
ncbi:MAG: site-specific DNA-methyltransferase, partial [Lentisphaeraceae bacterium]|nr:site-specific DNA-methyltransferase [Lentisphaeraceae bacterium]